MTQGRKPTFSFIPATQLKRVESKVLVSYNAQTQFMSFMRRDNPSLDNLIGKYIMLHADIEKKVLAWTFAPSEYTKADNMRGYTQIKETKVGEYGVVRFYVPRPVTEALKMTKNLKRHEVKRYEPTSYLDSNTLYHYIEL